MTWGSEFIFRFISERIVAGRVRFAENFADPSTKRAVRCLLLLCARALRMRRIALLHADKRVHVQECVYAHTAAIATSERIGDNSRPQSHRAFTAKWRLSETIHCMQVGYVNRRLF